MFREPHNEEKDHLLNQNRPTPFVTSSPNHTPSRSARPPSKTRTPSNSVSPSMSHSEAPTITIEQRVEAEGATSTTSKQTEPLKLKSLYELNPIWPPPKQVAFGNETGVIFRSQFAVNVNTNSEIVQKAVEKYKTYFFLFQFP